MLTSLHQHGILTAVLSNKYMLAVNQITDSLFPSLIDFSVGECEKVPRKPDPSGLNDIIAKYSLRPDDVAMVGDSDVDVLTAKNAGVCAIGVTWGFRNREVLSDNGAEFIVDTVCQLESLLLEL